jgi:predicted RNase H-like HicB family nuclease
MCGLSTNLKVTFERGENGYWIATIPMVPGAFSQGRTKAAARKNVLNALKELTAARRILASRHDEA